MTKLTHNFVRLVAALSTMGALGCPAEDDDDTTDPSIGTTMSTTNPSTTDADTDDPSGSETTDDPTTMTTDDPTTMTTDDPTTMTTDDPSDTGMECPMGSECTDDTMCAPGETCIGCLCIGGADTGTMECGTNVSTMNAACDDCSHMNCCPEVQGCFGDETVMMNTPCLELNNCIATNCTMATNLEELQACVDMECPKFADQLETWLAFNQCLAMNCMAQCAG